MRCNTTLMPHFLALQHLAGSSPLTMDQGIHYKKGKPDFL
ncbi:hypothetical protein PT7_3098 [Pusillimonas sp. T7-7]|nr:hypothetical protein PT7_3098 [Pusillimonas sp. T7-7]